MTSNSLKVFIALSALLLATTQATLYEYDLANLGHREALSSGVVAVKVGDQVRLVVDENPTTGYRWKYQESKFGVYEIELDSYRATQHEVMIVGTGGVRIIQLKVKGVGQERFQMVEVREWDFEGFESDSFSPDNQPYVKVDLVSSE